MRESYVEYILADCKGDRISSVCAAYDSTDDLIMAAKLGIRKSYILGQGNIVYALRNYLRKQAKIAFSVDARKLYNRCSIRTDYMYHQNENQTDIDYDELFELLVDINWIVGSIWAAERKYSSDVLLERNMAVIHTRLRDALENNFRQRAYWYEEQCSYIEESGKLKNQFLPGLCSNPEIQHYIPMSAYEREDAIRQTINHSVQALALYYALTATLIKSEEIRRMR